jgi:hypothetical protein
MTHTAWALLAVLLLLVSVVASAADPRVVVDEVKVEALTARYCVLETRLRLEKALDEESDFDVRAEYLDCYTSQMQWLNPTPTQRS